MKSLIKTFLLTFPLFAQYPADSLFHSSNINPLQKMLLYPITRWQRVSYNSSALGCQYVPNCSLYGAKAIHDNGAISGLFQTADRIVRCNEFARYHHDGMNGKYSQTDGRLIDHVRPIVERRGNKSPIIAAGLSFAVPGLGRVYGGRPFDGYYGFIITSISLVSAKKLLDKKSVFAPAFLGIGVTFWGGEIYGAYRTVKYY